MNAGVTTFSTPKAGGGCNYDETFLAATGKNAIPSVLIDPNARLC